MKFRKDGKLYIHKSDIYYVFAYNLDAPECLANALGSVREALSFNEEVDNSLVCFDKEEDIRQINEMKCFVEFDDVKDLSITDLETYIGRQQEEIDKTESFLTSLTNSMARQMEIDVMRGRLHRQALILKALKEFSLFKKGRIELELPEGITVEREMPVKPVKQEPKGLKKLLKFLNKKDNN